MKAQDIYHKMRAIAEPHHDYVDQIVAIAKWVESEFDYNPEKLNITIPKAELGKGNPMQWNHNKHQKLDLILLSKSQYKAKDGSYKMATICIDGNYYALKSDVWIDDKWNAEDYYNK